MQKFFVKIVKGTYLSGILKATDTPLTKRVRTSINFNIAMRSSLSNFNFLRSRRWPPQTEGAKKRYSLRCFLQRFFQRNSQSVASQKAKAVDIHALFKRITAADSTISTRATSNLPEDEQPLLADIEENIQASNTCTDNAAGSASSEPKRSVAFGASTTFFFNPSSAVSQKEESSAPVITPILEIEDIGALEADGNGLESVNPIQMEGSDTFSSENVEVSEPENNEFNDTENTNTIVLETLSESVALQRIDSLLLRSNHANTVATNDPVLGLAVFNPDQQVGNTVGSSGPDGSDSMVSDAVTVEQLITNLIQNQDDNDEMAIIPEQQVDLPDLCDISSSDEEIQEDNDGQSLEIVIYNPLAQVLDELKDATVEVELEIKQLKQASDDELEAIGDGATSHQIDDSEAPTIVDRVHLPTTEEYDETLMQADSIQTWTPIPIADCIHEADTELEPFTTLSDAKLSRRLLRNMVDTLSSARKLMKYIGNAELLEIWIKEGTERIPNINNSIFICLEKNSYTLTKLWERSGVPEKYDDITEETLVETAEALQWHDSIKQMLQKNGYTTYTIIEKNKRLKRLAKEQEKNMKKNMKHDNNNLNSTALRRRSRRPHTVVNKHLQKLKKLG